MSTLDTRCPSGDDIKIEERNGKEVIHFRSEQTAPSDVGTWNPAFDVAPAALITGGWITENGMWSPKTVAM